MDNRLDFFYKLNEYIKTLSTDDAVLFLSHNKKEGDCITMLAGDWQILSSLFSIKGYVNFDTGNEEDFKKIKEMILDTAYNICVNEKEYKEKFINGLKKI